MAVNVPIRAKFDASGVAQLKQQIRESQNLARLSAKLEREITKEQNAQIRAVKEQISQRKRLNSLTAKLDKDLAGKPSGGRGGAFGGALLGGALGAGGASLLIRAASEIYEFGVRAEEAGRQLEGTQSSLTHLLGSTAEYRRAMAEAKEITGGLVSEQKLAESEFLLLDSGIAKNTERAAKLSEAESILNTKFEALGASHERFVRLLSGGNKALYDNYNLTGAQIDARKRQIEAEGKLTGSEAKLQAIQELLIEKAGDLKSSMTDNEKAAAGFQRASEDLTAALGESLTPAAAHSRTVLTKLMDAWTAHIKTINDSQQATAEQRDALVLATSSYEEYQKRVVEVHATDLETLAILGLNRTAYADLKQELIDAAKAQKDKTAADELAAAAAERAAAAEERRAESEARALKRAEKVADTRRKTTLKLIDIDEQAQQKTAEEWDKFFETEAEDWKDHNRKISDLREKASQDLAKIDADLTKDLKKQSKDTARDLAKLDKDESKQIAEIQKKAADDQRHDEKRRKIDTLADERLFNFELRNLAAEGAANQIRQALERRAIEEQIAKEKAVVESQIEAEKQKDEITRVKEAAQEQRSELRQTAAEREQELRDNAELEQQIRQEKLGTELADEQDHYEALIQERRDYRDKKLAEIEQDKQESIAKLSEELATAQDLTAQELRALTPVAASLGGEAAIAWGQGFTKGIRTNEKVSSLLAADFSRTPGTGAGTSTGLGHPGMAGGFGFAHGGRVPGPLGQPRLIVAHGGEEFNNPAMPRSGSGAPQLNVTVSGPGLDQLAAIVERKMGEALQEYTDYVLAPALS